MTKEGQAMTTTIPHTRIPENSSIEESYELCRRLGQGSFGIVHEGRHKVTEISWAIKSILKEKAGSSGLKLIEREVAILKRVNHPNIIQLNEVLETPKQIYLVMELCEGGELADALKKNKHFSETATKTVITRLASAISYLHKNDIVHRDIKLENILLSGNPDDPKDNLHIKVTDFGLSVVKGGFGHDNMMQDFCGTPTYMSPEIIDNKTYSQQCDVWAMGVIMYTLLCGYAPFRSSDEDTLYMLIKKGEVAFEGDPWPTISEEAKVCIRGMLKVDPAHRLSAAELLDLPWVTGKNSDGKKNVLEMMKEFLIEGSNCDSDSGGAVNGDAPDKPDESASAAGTSGVQESTSGTSKDTSSNPRKGSSGAKRSSGSKTPPNQAAKGAAAGRSSAKPSATGGTNRTTLASASKTTTGTTGSLPATAAGRAGTAKRNPVNSKTPSSQTKNSKK